MTCRRCQGCMARDHFLDLQESGGEWWLQGWRCINCGHVFDPVLEKNRQLHAAGRHQLPGLQLDVPLGTGRTGAVPAPAAAARPPRTGSRRRAPAPARPRAKTTRP